MKIESKNFAYIDGANLYRGVESLGWKLDYRRFRVWLSEKYDAQRAYLFIGLIPKYRDLYTHLQECGYTLVFKEVVYDSDGKPKGNCDADLVLQATRDAYENKFDKAIIVSSDGDYASLIKFLKEGGKLKVILSPHTKNLCSILLKRTGVPIAYINDQRRILSYRNFKDEIPTALSPSGIVLDSVRPSYSDTTPHFPKDSAARRELAPTEGRPNGQTQKEKAPGGDETPQGSFS